MMPVIPRLTAIAVAVATVSTLSSAHATNGMLMEGYGPEATAMGGASMAFDNGTAAIFNNPSTLSLIQNGASRFDISLGNLRPDVSSSVPVDQAGNRQTAGSSGDSYLMPSVGWASRNGQLSYGVGMFSQGGMGTEYADDSVLNGGRSEVGVGAFLVPLSFKVNNQLSLGATLEYVWGGMDLIMGMPMAGPTGMPDPGTFGDFMPGAPNALGNASGTLVQGLGAALQANPPPAGSSAVFNFSNNDDFSGQAGGAGFGARIGFLYQVSPQLAIGGAYQAKTAMDDWDGSGNMSIIDQAGAVVSNMSMPGTYIVKDFQFPATLSVGMAYNMDKWLFAADLSQIKWSDAMADFNMNFTVDADVPGFGGASTDITMKQEWNDQTVLKLGVAHALNDQLTLRGGVNLADNPVPDAYMNPLFPAIIKNHFTAGASYAFNNNHSFGASLVVAPEVSQTNSQTGVKSDHSQANLQVMYSYRY